MTTPTSPFNWRGPSKTLKEIDSPMKRNCKPGKLPPIILAGTPKNLPPKDMKK